MNKKTFSIAITLVVTTTITLILLYNHRRQDTDNQIHNKKEVRFEIKNHNSTYYASDDANSHATTNVYENNDFHLLRELYVDEKTIYHFKHCLISGHYSVNETQLHKWYKYLIKGDKKACSYPLIHEIVDCSDISLPYTEYIIKKSVLLCQT
jgi:hypothetical protein